MLITSPVVKESALTLSAIYEPIRKDLTKVEDSLSAVSRTDFPWLSELLDYSLKGGGKRIRPALVLLSGKFYSYNLDYLLPMATAVELMHAATLIHDDAIDKSSIRRGKPTINNLWGGEKAVLLGDYLFAKAGETVTETQNVLVIRLFSQTLETITSGELNQAINAFNMEQACEEYLHRISGKTASLFSLATESGAILSQAPKKVVKALKEYGNNLGIAFQIVDDILDFVGTEEKMGKPIGSDLAQGTLTLPAMLILELYPENNPVKELFNNHYMPDKDKQVNIKQAIELVVNSPIVERCYATASDYCAKASQSLKELPDNTSRQALLELAEYVVARKR